MFGIVRRARRPPGWTAPGPRPTAAAGRADAWPRPGEDLCYLTGEWRILQRVDGHRWSLDDLVTAWTAVDELGASTPYQVLDLGCGIGAVLLMIAWRFPGTRLVGVEAQEVSVNLARRSLTWNGVDDRADIRCGDFRDPAVLPDGGVFDLVTGTPPYLPPGTATESPRVQCGPCHIEHRGGIEDYCRTVGRVLAPSGSFVTCAGGHQHARVERAAALASLAITRRLDVIPRAGKDALFSVYVMRHRVRAADRRIDPPLVVRDATGARTAAFREVRAAMGMPP